MKIKKYEKWIPLFLAVVFIALTASGLATMQNPDELVHRVAKALDGKWKFDEINFDYPSLPKYVMFGLGKITQALGFTDVFLSTARFLSVLLGAGTIYLVYWMTRYLGGGILASFIASLFVLTNHTFSINARFAHNDLYLTFFLTLTLYFLILYIPSNKLQKSFPKDVDKPQEEGRKEWLYAAFFSVGLAASSKFNGGVFLLLPLLVYTLNRGKELFAEKLKTLETFFIGIVLTFLGFALGTPKSLLWVSFYFKRVLPALSRHATFGKTSESVVGFLGQWRVLRDALGFSINLIVLSAFLYFLFKYIFRWRVFKDKKAIWLVLLALLIFDLPIMLSYNYQARFFIPLIPFFAILAALFVADGYAFLLGSKHKKYHFVFLLALGGIFVFSFLRVISVRLLIQNDPRIAASEFIATLPKGGRLEYTMYPPDIPFEHFEDEYSYPIFFTKFEGQEVPEVGFGKAYGKFNEGEAGLIKRDVDYFVIDSFTYARCESEAIYATNPLECAFFAELLAGETSYLLIGDFRYSLPSYLPQISIAFVNPEVQVFEKRE